MGVPQIRGGSHKFEKLRNNILRQALRASKLIYFDSFQSFAFGRVSCPATTQQVWTQSQSGERFIEVKHNLI